MKRNICLLTMLLFSIALVAQGGTISGKVTGDAKGKKIESDVKVWMSKSVALSGMVKMELKSNIVNMQMELSGSGNEK